MKQFLILLVTAFTSVSPVCAGLGDNDDIIDVSYGNLVERHLLDNGTVSTLYHKDRYLYFVLFDRGRSVLERYSRTDGRELSPKEISKFLKANAGHGKWIENGTSKGRRFERSDHKVEATYLEMEGRATLVVRGLGAGTVEKEPGTGR